jgi:hypothetical protein
LGYLALKAVILGSLTGAVGHFLEQKKLLCHEFFTPFTIGRFYPESFLLLFQDPLFWLGCLGVGWIWKKDTPSPGVALWIWNFFLWSGVYLTAVYWHRFALPSLFLACPLAAHFLRNVARRLTAGIITPPPRWLAPGIIATFLVLFHPVDGLDFFKQIFICQSSAPLRLVQYLRTHVPPRCLIETPEYELVFLDDDHRIHLMPSYFFVESTPDKVVLLNPRQQPYEFNRVGADILILGRFGKGVFKQVYPPALINREWRRVAQIDCYDIYVCKKSAKKMLSLMSQTLASHQKASQIRTASKHNVSETLVDSYHH